MDKKLASLIDKYTYRLEWSEEDQAHIARCLELPSLSAHGNSSEAALKEIKKVVIESLKWMKEEGEFIPEAIGAKKYNGKISLRISPELHREITLKSAEQNISVNKYINEKLSKVS